MGFLPQLSDLENQLHQGLIEPEVADLRLNRFEAAIENMIMRLDQSGQDIAAANLDDLQEATLAGLFAPLRAALEATLNLSTQIPTDTPWPAEIWAGLHKAQEKIALGYRALGLLSQLIATPHPPQPS